MRHEGKQRVRHEHLGRAPAAAAGCRAGTSTHPAHLLASTSLCAFLSLPIASGTGLNDKSGRQIKAGSKLSIDKDGDPHLDYHADWTASVRRWYTGQGRHNSLLWLEGLARRVKELASQQMRYADEADAAARDEGTSGLQTPDVCPQCTRAACSCLSVGKVP